eukprot:1143247-Pelagomonas_calceolata.AAC.12
MHTAQSNCEHVLLSSFERKSSNGLMLGTCPTSQKASHRSKPLFRGSLQGEMRSASRLKHSANATRAFLGSFPAVICLVQCLGLHVYASFDAASVQKDMDAHFIHPCT